MQCAARIPRHRAISSSLFSRIFLILGDQILMISNDFGGPGAHFGGLGAHFEGPADFLRFWSLSATKKESLFEVIFDTFLIHFLVFFECPFFLIFCDLGCPEAPFWEAFWITFLAEARKRKSVFGLHRRVRIAYPAFPNCIIFGDFLAGALRKASGTRCLTILSDFGLPGGDHLAPKRHQKMRPKKVVKNGHASSTSNGLWAP